VVGEFYQCAVCSLSCSCGGVNDEHFYTVKVRNESGHVIVPAVKLDTHKRLVADFVSRCDRLTKINNSEEVEPEKMFS